MPIITTYINAQGLNASLQVGDKVYSTPVSYIPGEDGMELDIQSNLTVGKPQLVGILRQIQVTDGFVELHIEQYDVLVPSSGDFLMFSKYSQTDGDLLGYYAEAKFVNNSKIKAELFSVGSEITINSQ
jgi:hypothetical protein